MEKDKIIQTVQNLFAGADERNWQKVMGVMSKNVLLDYTSLAGGTASNLTPKQITNAWARFLPGFDRTHHQLSDFEVESNESTSSVRYAGKGDHFIGREVWTVEGTYDTELQNEAGLWVITKHKFNFLKQSGNTDLPSTATQIMKNKN